VLDMQALGSSRECSSVSHLVELCWPLVAGGHVNVLWHCSVLACAELRWLRRCRLLCVLASRAKSALTMHRCLDRMSGVCFEPNDSMSSSCRLTITQGLCLRGSRWSYSCMWQCSSSWRQLQLRVWSCCVWCPCLPLAWGGDRHGVGCCHRCWGGLTIG
jgi:hypothetical protein